MQVKIPVHLVPRAYVDYDMEQRQLLRQDYVLPDGLRVPPLTAGRLMALELIASEFFLHPDACAQLDIAAALVLMTCGQHLIADFTRGSPGAPPVEDADPASPASAAGGLAAFPDLAQAAASFLAAHSDAVFADYPALVRWCVCVPFYGFDMLPKDGAGAQKECWFDGAFAGSVLAPASKLLATPYEMILWDIPLCVVWHALAQQAAAFGVKGVERPPDTAVLRRMMREAAEREERGLLHPWQYADPVSYGLTAEQFRRNPHLAQLFARMAADFERGKRRPLDPADYPLPPCAGEAAGRGPAPSQCAASLAHDTITVPGASVDGLMLSVNPSASAAERTSAVEEYPHGI